jgi:integrase
LVCALAWGARGREFKSHRPDHLKNTENVADNEVLKNPNAANAESNTKDSPNISGALEGTNEPQVKFPKRLRHRGKGRVLATIYKRPGYYRLYWRTRVNGKPKSLMKDFKTYADAKRKGDGIVADLAKGKATGLSPGQLADAQNALEELQRYYQETGKRVSIRFAVGEYCEAARKLDGRTLAEAMEGFLSTVAKVKRVDLSEAVEQFIESRKIKTVAKDGKRPQLSPGWHYIVSQWLREFAKTFPGHAVCDLSREHLTTYVNGHGEVSARTRNGRRNTVKMFLKWSVERDYLATNHRLLVADGMSKEIEDFGDIEFYTPKELRAMLDCASTHVEFRSVLPVIALGGLAGLRLQEIARLTWGDVWRVAGHVEITAGKAKTRQRRLVEIGETLAAWLKSFSDHTGNVWAGTLDGFHDIFGKMRDELKIPARRNGLRHAFCTYHFALHANENLTASQAGSRRSRFFNHWRPRLFRSEQVR